MAKKQIELQTGNGDISLELEQIVDEWRETRRSIDRFDHISIDLRKYGFSLITFLITASSIAFGTTELDSPLPVLIAPFAIMILICGLFLVDRYYEVLLLGCILRSRQLEDESQYLLENHVQNRIYRRLNLTTFMEEKIQKARARTFSSYVYVLLIVASFLLGAFSLYIYYQGLGQTIFEEGRVPSIFLSVTLIAVGVFFLSINYTMKNMIAELQDDVIIDNRIVVRTMFRKEQVARAVKKLASQIYTAYFQEKFVIVAAGVGGLYLAQRLIDQLKKLGRRDFETVSVFAEKVETSHGRQIRLIDPPKASVIKGRKVLIVDDLVSSGKTLDKLRKTFKHYGAASVRAAIMLNAPNRRKVNGLRIEFVGLKTDSDQGSYVGCGMDVYGECRELSYIGVVRSYSPKKI